MADYESKVAESSRKFTARERIKFQDLADAVSLDTAAEDGAITFAVKDYAILQIHNEHSEDKDYIKYVLEAEDGTLYVTGSESFWRSFINIYNEMKDEDEAWELKVFKKDSTNYKGKKFITCTIK